MSWRPLNGRHFRKKSSKESKRYQMEIKSNEKGFKYASLKRLGSNRNALTAGKTNYCDISLDLSRSLLPPLFLSLSLCAFNACVNYLLLTYFYGFSVEKRVKSSQVKKWNSSFPIATASRSHLPFPLIYPVKMFKQQR